MFHIRKSQLFLGGAAACLALTGISISTDNAIDPVDAAPFLTPTMIANSACSDDNGRGGRRAFFIRTARAIAETLPTASDPPAMPPADLGAIAYTITTDNPEAQAWFNVGLAHTQNFNHGEAVNAFIRAQELDPDCAMCFWGEAFARGPNINAPMMDEDVAPAFAATRQAIALRDKASEREAALITALGYRYEGAPLADRSKLDNAFADEMDKVAIAYPDDDLVAALAAEANMDTQPWDYWEADDRTPKGRTARTLSLLEGVLARSPENAAAIHLYIHITEATNDPYRAAPYADVLADITPGLGHLIHMPSHVYYRIGRFKQSLDHNMKAVAVDQQFVENHDAHPMYEFGYFTHNIHFAMTSAMMIGDGEAALSMAELLDEKLPESMAVAVPFAQPIKASPYYAMVMFAEPSNILNTDSPPDDIPFLKASWHYARGEAFAKLGDADGAYREMEAIAEIIANGDFSALEAADIPAVDILRISQLTVAARAAALEEKYDTAIEAMTEAVSLQEGLRYTEPPFWYYPAKQTLAAMVLQGGDAERAEQLFLESLTYSPNNAWVLYGLSEAYKAEGDKSAAKYAAGMFKKAWGGEKKPKLSLAQL